MMRRTMFALFLLFRLACPDALPAREGMREGTRIVFAVDPTYPPLEFMENGNRIVGYSVEYFGAVCREAGLEAEFRGVEWEGIFDRLNAGEFDAVMSSVSGMAVPYPQNSVLVGLHPGERDGLETVHHLPFFFW